MVEDERGGRSLSDGSKNRPHDAYPVRCRVPGYYEPCSEGLRVCQLNKSRQLKKLLQFRVIPRSEVVLL